MKKTSNIIDEYEALVQEAAEKSNNDTSEFSVFLVKGIDASQTLRQSLFVINFWKEDDNKKVIKAFTEYALGKDIISIVDKHTEDDLRFDFDLATTTTKKYSSN